jgi:hypothetical protein
MTRISTIDERMNSVRKVILTTKPQLHPFSNSSNATKNYYCKGVDTKGFQIEIDLQAMPPGVTISQIEPNQVWWVEKRTTLYRLYLYGGMYNPATRHIDSTATISGNNGGYASLTGPGKTQISGALTQEGGFTVNDVNNEGINLQNSLGDAIVISPGGGYSYLQSINNTGDVSTYPYNYVYTSNGGNYLSGGYGSIYGDTGVVIGAGISGSIYIGGGSPGNPTTNIAANDAINITSTGTITISGGAVNIYPPISGTSSSYASLTGSGRYVTPGALTQNGDFTIQSGTLTVFSGIILTSSFAQNIGIGYNPLYNNSGGNDNVGIGSQALYYNSGGNDNIGIGYQTLYSNISGKNNVGIGSQALYYNSGGNDNVGIGYEALYNNGDGFGNTAVGFGALFQAANHSPGYYSNYNTAIGYNAGSVYDYFSGTVSIGVDSSGNSAQAENDNDFILGTNLHNVQIPGTFFPPQHSSAPTYVKGAVYFDTTLNKLRVGGATGWETITSV